MILLSRLPGFDQYQVTVAPQWKSVVLMARDEVFTYQQTYTEDEFLLYPSACVEQFEQFIHTKKEDTV